MRLDIYLYQSGKARSRTRAAELISNGCVEVGGVTVVKPSFDVCGGEFVEVVAEEHGFVGRGGMKLDGALKRFNIDVSGAVCADIGASTGGFTDCLLKNGAARVYAVDAGHSQLDKTLLADARVINIEGCNARFLDETVIVEKCGVAVCDLSFISQTLVIPAVVKILAEDALFISLVKPQFECGREAIGKNGIVKDKKQHIAAVRRVVSCLRENRMSPKKVMKSPIKGGDGNTEFLILASASSIFQNTITDDDVREAVYE